MAGWLAPKSRRKELSIMDIIRLLNQFVKKQQPIKSKVPANCGHSLLPIRAENKRYRENIFPTILLKYQSGTGAKDISGNKKLAQNNVGAKSLANTEFLDTKKRKPPTSARYKSKDALRELGSRGGANLGIDIHNELAPAIPPAKLAPNYR